MSTDLNTKFIEDPLSFMQKYSVLAPDTIGHNIGVKMRSMSNTTGNDYDFTSMHQTRKVAYLNFEKTPKGVARSMGGGKGAGTMSIDGSFTAAPGKVKSYFLPWNAGSGIFRLAIPEKGTALVDDDVRYFFTAAINGCSIFVKGTPRAPEIYHAGGNTGHGKDPVKAAAFWRDLMVNFSGPEAITGEINKMDYISNPNARSGFTQHADTFSDWLKSEAKGDLNIETIEPWGCVMGLRDLRGDWGFYLQENATIHHSKFKKVLFVQTKKKIKGTETSSSRPMLFRKFFPGGLGHVDFTPTMPRKIV